MIDRIKVAPCQQRQRRGHSRFNQFNPAATHGMRGVQVGVSTGGKVINHSDVGARGEQRLAEVRADEARTTCD